MTVELSTNATEVDFKVLSCIETPMGGSTQRFIFIYTCCYSTVSFGSKEFLKTLQQAETVNGRCYSPVTPHQRIDFWNLLLIFIYQK